MLIMNTVSFGVPDPELTEIAVFLSQDEQRHVPNNIPSVLPN
jgi:hypothetical protein